MEKRREKIKRFIKNEIFNSRIDQLSKANLLQRIDMLFGAGQNTVSMDINSSTIDLIYNSNLILDVKFQIMERLDSLFRNKLGIIFKRNDEIEHDDLLLRSM